MENYGGRGGIPPRANMNPVPSFQGAQSRGNFYDYQQNSYQRQGQYQDVNPGQTQYQQTANTRSQVTTSPSPNVGRGDEWDAFFSKPPGTGNSTTYPPNQSQYPQGNQQQASFQKQLPSQQTSTVPSSLDRANQLLRNLHQTTDISTPAIIPSNTVPQNYNPQRMPLSTETVTPRGTNTGYNSYPQTDRPSSDSYTTPYDQQSRQSQVQSQGRGYSQSQTNPNDQSGYRSQPNQGYQPSSGPTQSQYPQQNQNQNQNQNQRRPGFDVSPTTVNQGGLGGSAVTTGPQGYNQSFQNPTQTQVPMRQVQGQNQFQPTLYQQQQQQQQPVNRYGGQDSRYSNPSQASTIQQPSYGGGQTEYYPSSTESHNIQYKSVTEMDPRYAQEGVLQGMNAVGLRNPNPSFIEINQQLKSAGPQYQSMARVQDTFTTPSDVSHSFQNSPSNQSVQYQSVQYGKGGVETGRHTNQAYSQIQDLNIQGQGKPSSFPTQYDQSIPGHVTTVLPNTQQQIYNHDSQNFQSNFNTITGSSGAQQNRASNFTISNIPQPTVGSVPRQSRFSSVTSSTETNKPAIVPTELNIGVKRSFQNQSSIPQLQQQVNSKVSRSDSNISRNFTPSRTNSGRTVISKPVIIRERESSNVGRDRDHSRKSPSSSRGRGTKRVAPVVNVSHRRSRSRSRSRERRRVNTKSDFPTSLPVSHVPSNKKIEPAKLTHSMSLELYNIPLIGRYVHALSVQDLSSRFPNLYVPADLVRVEISWSSLISALSTDFFRHIHETGAAEVTTHPASVEDDSLLPTEPPRITYATPEETHLLSFSCCHRINYGAPKSVKFNARVLVTLGMTNSDTERVDFSLPKKLRVVLGRRKSNSILLGGAWCRDLDGGDPLLDRACLVNTARRLVLAQSMLDLEMCGQLVKACEIIYQRPQEELKGKAYPEQDEVTVVYICAVQPKAYLSDDDFELIWENYCGRIEGRYVGPTAVLDAHTASETLFQSNRNQLQLVSQADINAVEVHSDNTGNEIKSEIVDLNENEANAVSDVNVINEEVYVPERAQVDMEEDSEQLGSSESLAENKEDSKVEIETESSTKQQESKVTNKEDIVDNTEDSTNSKHQGTSALLSSTKRPQKPSKPCALMCPLPLSKEQALDPVKRLEGISLRSLTLNHILSYSESDSNERIFEVSISAEILRSLLAVDYADIITDFLFAEYSPSTYCGDPRVMSATKVLREMTKKLNSKSRRDKEDTTSQRNDKKETEKSTEESSAKTAGFDTNLESKNLATESENNGVEISEVEEGENVPSDNIEDNYIHKNEDSADTDPNVINEPESIDEDRNENENENESAKESENEKMNENEKEYQTSELNQTSTDQPEEKEERMSESDARDWRRIFVNACRWYDLDQQRYLRQDHVEFILYSSTRDLSRAELSAAIAHACKDDKLRYEIYI